MSESSESPPPSEQAFVALPRGMEMDTPPPYTTSDYDSANNVTPPPFLQSLPRNKKRCGGLQSDITQVTQDNCTGGHNTTLSDSLEEEEDNQSLCSSKDSGCDKSSRGGSPRNNSAANNGKSTPSKVDLDLDSSSTLLWGASLLYYTGISSPKVKEHHFTSASLAPSSFSFFGRKIRSSYSMSDMDRAPGSPLKKFSTLPKSPSKDSGTGSSVITVDAGGGSGSNEGGGTTSSPLRKRHASCSSSSSMGSTSMMSTLKGRIKGNTNSLRLLKVSRPSLSSFMEKTQSLPRTRKNRVCEEMAAASAAAGAAIPEGTTINQQDSGISTGPETGKSSGSTSSLKSARKALRNSFKAARNLLPGSSSSSSSKISPTGKTSFQKKSSHEDKEKLDGQLYADDNNEEFSQFMANNSNESTDPMPNSAPNTPIIKKSRLQRARKKFASTLSLHGSNHDNTSGKGSHRSKSVSTLAISDSEIASAPHGVVSNAEDSISVENLGSSDVLAVVQDSSCSKSNKDEVVVSKKGDSSSSSRSPFRFIGRSRNKEKVEKSETSTPESEQNKGFEIQQHKQTATTTTTQGEAIRQDETESEEKPSVGDSTGKEKPKKKRMSIVKSIGKAIRSGKGSREANMDPVIVNKTSALTMESEPVGEGNKIQEILTFDNEPRVRTPKASRRHRLNSGSGSTSSSGVGGAASTLRSSQERDKDREIHELEVSETAIDISPRKLSHLLKAMAPVTSTQSKDAMNGQKTLDKDNNRPTTTVDDDYDRDIINDSKKPVSQDGERGKPKKKNSEPIQLIKPEEQKKKTKSQSLITSLVSSSTSDKKGNNSVDGDSKSKSKKKSSKKSKKKSSNSQDDSQEQTTTFTASNNNQSVTKSGGEISSSPVTLSNVENSNNNNKETELLLGKSQVSSTSVLPSVFSSSSRSNRRKSSEDYKDMRKNASAHSIGTPPFITTPETTKRRSILEDIQVELQNEEGVVPPSTSLLSIGKRSSSSKSLLNDQAKSGRDWSDVVKGTRSASECYAEQLKELTAKIRENDARIRTESQGENNEVDETDPETACTESFRQLKPFNYDLEPVEEGKKERLYKVLVVGELGAGKTSIIKRYVHQFFSQHYRATIGVDFALKVLRWDPDTVVRLQLWDIAGQERFGSMTRVYYKEAVGAFVVFDVTRSATLEAVPKWKADLDAKVALPDGRPIPTVLLANKSDQPKEGIAANREKMNEFCQQQGLSAWFETSAKDNINIDESANFLVSKILEMDKWSQEPLAPDPDKVELTANGKHKGAAPSNCAC